MKDKYTAEPADTGDSWANETLPMGVRRELLDREIQKLIERKARAQAGNTQAQGDVPERSAGRERAG